MKRISPVKGTRDFYPDQMRQQQWLIEAWRRVSLRNGFEEVGGPVFEYLELYTVKSGEGIVSELFSFEDRGGRQLALRPEFTPTLARMISARANALARPIKWFSVPNFFRAERPQRGRLREFYQWNLDVVGSDAPVADAEVIFSLIDLLAELGVQPAEAKVFLSSRPLLAEMLLEGGIQAEQHELVFTVMDKIDKIPPDAWGAHGREQGLGAAQLQTLRALAQRRDIDELRSTDSQAAHQLVAVWDRLAELGAADWLQLDLGIVRGLAYYTGVVFEVFDAARTQRAVAGGGRYDQLIETFGGPAMPAVGVGSGDVPTLVLLESLGKLPPLSAQTDVFLVRGSDQAEALTLKLTACLRRAGMRAIFSYRSGSGVGKQLKEADAAAARWVLIIGADGSGHESVTVKEMAGGQQWQVGIDALMRDPRSALKDR